MGLPCLRSEENYARRGIAVGAAVAAATARGVGPSRVEPGPVLELAVAQPHWQAAAQLEAHEQCICMCGAGLELKFSHSQPPSPAPVTSQPCALMPPCDPAATPAAHLGVDRITSLDLSYLCVQVPLPLLMGLPRDLACAAKKIMPTAASCFGELRRLSGAGQFPRGKAARRLP